MKLLWYVRIEENGNWLHRWGEEMKLTVVQLLQVSEKKSIVLSDLQLKLGGKTERLLFPKSFFLKGYCFQKVFFFERLLF